MYLGSNASPDEIIKYGNPCDLIPLFDVLICEKNELKKELKDDELYHELLREQLYFAKELIEEILIMVDRETKARDIKKEIIMLVENSMLER